MPLKNKKQYNAYMNEYMKRRYVERRNLAFEFLGGECNWCGSKMALEIDHVDQPTKAVKLNKLWNISLKKFYDELQYCQLLCNDCHKEKTKKDMSR